YSGHVLDRKPNDYGFGQLKFEVAFDLCIVWLIVFLSLCRGPKSLGKVVLILGIMPSILLLLVTMRIIEQWGEGIMEILPSSWKVSMTDSQVRIIKYYDPLLAQILTALIYFDRNVAILSVASISILLIASLLFASIMNIFPANGLNLLPTSYESEDYVKVLKKFPTIKHQMQNISVINYIVGNGFIIPKQSRFTSGYQVIRFATEVFPASLAVEGIQRISSFWAICFYAMMILFGLGQQIVLWSCVVESFISMKYKLLKSWQSTITFIMCNIAFLLGLPITSNIGIYIVFFMDFCMGALWWIIALYMSMMVAVLFVRGQKYGTDKIILMLSQQTPIKGWILPALTFQWNVILPVSFLVLFITFLRSSEFEAKFPWSEPVENYASWSLLIRRLAVWFQVTPLLLLCVYCVYQGFLYLVPKSDLTFSQRIQAWCCPVIEMEMPIESESQSESSTSSQGGIINSCYVDDPPPKYTPPPSYSTATARMMIKQLNPRSSVEIESTLRTANVNLQRTLDGSM
ncbi:sodium- and chloride-dependent glycine transporter 1-like, partial [Centruroides sculpturatus]|uniref:sodium- and chloride-dependent glycine transporter 1-like n=1 Tax=Centruroides sculpturatus TaxID=218467 RepID=UPI000C6C90DA